MNFLKELCELLDIIIIPVIISMAILEFVFMIRTISHLIKFRYRITKLISKRVLKASKSIRDKNQLTTKVEMELIQNWEDFDKFLEDYQDKGWWYTSFSLIIQIFTLLGILGTVAGLYLAMSNGQDIYQGVEFALSTTILGILFAVIYKVADICIVSFLVNYIDDGIDRYEKIYQVKNEEAKTAVQIGREV